MDLKDRYNREHKHGNVTFYLSDFTPEPEQCRFLMLKVLEQTVRDYCSLVTSELPNERVTWEMARDFLFDDNYKIMWGDWELNIVEFLEILDIDADWFREQTTKKFREQHGDKYVQIERPTRRNNQESPSTSVSTRRY